MITKEQSDNLKCAFAENDIPWPKTRKLRRMTLFWHPTGPQIDYTADRMLHMADLNPECKMQWRMGRREMFRLGWNCIKAALWRPG